MSWQNGHNEKPGCYFSTYQTVDWIDIFIRPVYKQVIVHTLNHFIESKGLVVYSWCLMTHHLHLLAEAQNGSMQDLEKDFKLFTTKKILEALDTEPEARKHWMLKRFEDSGGFIPGLNKKYHVWEKNNKAAYESLKKIDSLLSLFDHIHQNPVRDKIVDLPEEYLYSSARDYAGMKGIVNITKLPLIEQQLSATESVHSNFFVKYVRN
jgi:hypothetical protein